MGNKKSVDFPATLPYAGHTMNPGLTIFVCFAVITPICAWGAWHFWMPMMQEQLEMVERGEARATQGHPSTVNPA